MAKITSDANESASSKQVDSENISPDDFMRLRLGATADIPEGEPPEQPVAEVPESEDETELAEEQPEESSEQYGIEDEPEATEEDDTALSQLNLEDLSPEELEALGERIKSNVPKRIGELTAKRKAAEEEAARLKAELEQLRDKKNPLETEEPIENNPFADIADVASLQKEWKQAGDIIEWADDLLDENDHASFDDIITEVDGKELTKRQVKEYLKNAKKSRDKFLPARFEELQVAEQSKQVEAVMQQKAEAEISWLKGDDNDTRREYEAVINDPRIQEIAEKVPAVAPQLKYLIAHAVNSYVLTQQKATAPKKKTSAPRSNPPHNPASNTAKSVDHVDGDFKKQLGNLTERFQQSHSVNDFTKIRAAQIAKRRNR